MRRPARENFRSNGHTYFVSSQTVQRKPFFRNDRWAMLMEEMLQHYRGNSYLLHAYVIMPDHIHVILSPNESVERAMQKIKGGFSFRAKSALDWKHDIWQPGFADHRIRDAADWDCHIAYLRHNPVKNKLCSSSQDYRYLAFDLDPIPQRLKPLTPGGFAGGAEAPPLQKLQPVPFNNSPKTAETFDGDAGTSRLQKPQPGSPKNPERTVGGFASGAGAPHLQKPQPGTLIRPTLSANRTEV